MAKESSKPKTEHDYEADNALDTLTRAEEIKADQKLMNRVAKKAGRKVKALTGLKDTLDKHGKKKPKSIDDLKKMSNAMALGSTPDDDYDDVDGG